MDMNKVKYLFAALGAELGLDVDAAPESTPHRPPVFDVQPLGYSRLGAVEAFRTELLASNDPLQKRFAATLPEWWFVQDQEAYTELTTEQQALQEFNCGNARFSMAIMGVAADGSTMWRTFWPAVVREWNEEKGQMVDTPIVHTDGKPVYAVPNDSRTWGGKTLTTNPRVADMDKVVRAAFAYFKLTNENAVRPIEDAYVGR